VLGRNRIYIGMIKRLHYPLRSALMLLLLFMLFSGCSERPLAPLLPHPLEPQRIVSLAPSITEVLFALGLSERIVGATRYCDYPPEALEIPRVGGYFDVNYEALLLMKPDLVIMMKEHEDAALRLSELGIRTLAVNHSRVDGILESISVIGSRCGVEADARELRDSLEDRIQKIQRAMDRSTILSHANGVIEGRPRVMIAVGRLMEKGVNGEIYISGKDGFYDDLVSLAGGRNAYGEETLKFPAISAEGVVRLDPDIIIEMVPDLQNDGDLEEMMDYWKALPAVRAVKDGNVHILGDDFVVVPGPRFILLLERIASIVHPEIEWGPPS